MTGHAIVAPGRRHPTTAAADLLGVLRLIAGQLPPDVEVCAACGSLELADSPCAVCRMRRTS